MNRIKHEGGRIKDAVLRQNTQSAQQSEHTSKKEREETP
jgi:hypothetical protein